MLMLLGTMASPVLLKAESLGEVVLNCEQDHLSPLVYDLFRSSLCLLVQNCFIVSKVLSLWIEMNSVLGALGIQIMILFLFLYISEVLLYCHLLFCV